MNHRYLFLALSCVALWLSASCLQSPPPAPEPPPKAPLEFEVRYTGGAKPDDTLPLVVGIHGLGDHPKSFARLVESWDVPARVLIPQGVNAYGRGFSWFAPSGGKGFDVLAPGVSASAIQVADLIRWARKHHPTRGKTIVFGFSQGGILSFTLATNHASTVDLAVPLGGYLPKTLREKRNLSTKDRPLICALHGSTDNRVPTEPTVEVVKDLQLKGFDAHIKLYSGVGHKIPHPIRKDLLDTVKMALTQNKLKCPQ